MSERYFLHVEGGSSGSVVNIPKPGFDRGGFDHGGFDRGTGGAFRGNLSPAEEGSIRLVNGDNPFQGRLEVFHNKEWGTVCKDGFDMRDLKVVCRQLGLDGSGMVKTPDWFGHGFGKIWMTGLGCDGDEGKLTGCSYKGWDVKECRHSEDVGVECFESHTRVNVSLCVIIPKSVSTF